MKNAGLHFELVKLAAQNRLVVREDENDGQLLSRIERAIAARARRMRTMKAGIKKGTADFSAGIKRAFLAIAQ